MKRLLFASVMALTLVGCGNDDTTQKQRFLIRGNEALRQRDFREATRVYQEAIKLDSCYVDALNNLGVLFFEQRHFSKAIQQYDQALVCQPDYFEALMNRVNVFYELNELYRALDDLKYISQTAQDSAQVHFMLGLVHTKLRDYDEAISAFDKSLALDSANPETLINRGTLKYYQKRLEEGERDLKSALKIDPLESNAYNAMSLIESERGNYDKALELVNRALDLEDGQPYFLNNRGFIYLNKGLLKEAKADIDQSITVDPNNGWAYRNKGYYYYLEENYEEALLLYQQAIKKDAFIDKVYLFQGQAYLKLNRIREACASFNKAAENKEDISQFAEKCA